MRKRFNCVNDEYEVLKTIYKDFSKVKSMEDIGKMMDLLYSNNPIYALKMLILLIIKNQIRVYHRAIYWFIHHKEANILLKNNLNTLLRYGDWNSIIIKPLMVDSYFRHQCVQMIAQRLKIDRQNLLLGEKVSSCALYAPSEKKSLDKYSNIVHAICQELAIDMSDDGEKYKKYRQVYLAPLRKAFHNQNNTINDNRSIFSAYNGCRSRIPSVENKWRAIMKDRILFDDSVSVLGDYIDNIDMKYEAWNAIAHLSHCQSHFCKSTIVSDKMYTIQDSLIDYIRLTESLSMDRPTLDTILNTLNTSYGDTLDKVGSSADNQNHTFPPIIYVFSQKEYPINIDKETLNKYKYPLPVIVNILMTNDLPIVYHNNTIGKENISVVTISGWSTAVRELLLTDQEITNAAIIKKEFDLIDVTPHSAPCVVM